ncbi:MAG: hypothetical protein RBJ76_03225 [Stenomitos frigidus ULC029]
MADHLGIKRSQYREEHLAKFQEFQAVMKEQGWTVNQAIATLKENADRSAPQQPQSPPAAQEQFGDAFNETYGHVNREGNSSALSLTEQRAAQIKQNAQRAAGDIEIATNLITTMYLTTGQYDDPEVRQQVLQSQQLLEGQICSTSTTHGLGKLLAATGIPGLQTIPAIRSAHDSLTESMRQLGSGQH